MTSIYSGMLLVLAAIRKNQRRLEEELEEEEKVLRDKPARRDTSIDRRWEEERTEEMLQTYRKKFASLDLGDKRK